jgi:hypothetical protein
MKNFTLPCIICLISILNFFVAYSQTDVLTQHNDLNRTGWNNQETVLTTGNVNTNTFGLLYTRTVDDQVYAQPLVVSGVNIPSKGAKNIVYVCTVNSTVYAFDADDGTVPAYWQVNYTQPGFRAPNKSDMHPGLCGGSYNDFASNIGIIGTPVIDKSTNTLYFVTKVVSTASGVEDNHAWNGSVPNEEYTYTTAGFFQYLHAVDLSTGAEKFSGPVNITATLAGQGDGNVGGMITFDPRRQFNRGGLVLSKGIVYLTFAAHCDWNPAHGWVIGYDASTLQQKMAYISTPNDGRGGIWMSGAAPAADAAGNLYFNTGNAYDDEDGFTDVPGDTVNRGESVVKLTPNAADNTATALKISSFFTPSNYRQLNDADLDFPIQTLLIPNTNMLLTGCKGTFIYLLNTTNLGGFSSTGPDAVLQSIAVSGNAQMHSSFAYFGGATNQYVYQFSENTLLQSYKIGATSLGTPVSGSVSGPTGTSGAYMSVSSNGSDATTGVLWISQAVNGCNANQSTCAGVLRAVRADDVTTELWNSNINPSDNFGNFAKMNCPTIANGKVYLNTFSNHLAVYGLVFNNSSCVTNVALNKTAVASSLESSSFPASNAFDGNATTRWSSQFSDAQWIYVDLGAEYDICGISINWETALGQNFTVDVSNDAVTWTTVQAFTGNAATTNTISGNFQGRYVRMNGTKRATAFGYSIYEMRVLGQLSNPCSTPTNLTSTNIAQNTATLNWQAVSGATSYNIQYKTSIVSSWVTRTTTSTSINISALTCGTGYTYQVQAVCAAGTSAQATGTFTTSTCTAACGPLPTRYFSADIGDIGVAGSSCMNSGIYTLKGSGNDIGGNGDQFQYAFTNLSGDEHVFAEVLTQDATNAANKVGLMFRDSVSNTSKFAFIATTSSTGIVFEYRIAAGGSTTTVNIPSLKAPYWIELNKSGTQYSAYVSATGLQNSWFQVGTTVDLGFGSSPVYIGMAITSANNSTLSTATIGSFTEVSSPLAIDLINFTASNINNQNILLKWSTSAEINNKYFGVERSDDGVSFQEIMEVNAIGNSNIQQNYSATDYHPDNGLNFYRLKEVDSDGTITYSPVIAIIFGNQDAPKIFPNPASSYFTVTAGQEAMKGISIIDVSGKIIRQVVNNGSSAIRISSVNLAAGIYIIKVTTATKVYQQKLFKQ